jgi:predicted peptidase
MLNGFSGVQSTLCQGFAGVNQSITNATIADMQSTNTLENAVQAVGTQLASCCCDIRSDISRGLSDLGYALATQECQTRQAIADSTRDIIDSNNAGVRAILDFLTQDKIAALTAENQSLKFAASQSAQNAYLVSELGQKCPVPAYVVPNPYCCTTYSAPSCGGCNFNY